MKYRIFLAGLILLITACNEGPEYNLSISVVSPQAAGDTTDVSYLIEWTVTANGWYESYIDIFADTDQDPSAGQVMIAESLSVESTAFAWVCELFPDGDYYIRAIVHEGAYSADDYSDGLLTVIHE